MPSGGGGPAGDLGSFVGIMGGSAALDPVAIAPKKANWDLKRDVEGRLAKLDRQTQAAIRELIRTCAVCVCVCVRVCMCVCMCVRVCVCVCPGCVCFE